MNIKHELIHPKIAERISGMIKDEIRNLFETENFDLNEIAQTTAISALSEIQQVIQDDDKYDDFEAVERIVCIFEKYNISAGTRHDF